MSDDYVKDNAEKRRDLRNSLFSRQRPKSSGYCYVRHMMSGPHGDMIGYYHHRIGMLRVDGVTHRDPWEFSFGPMIPLPEQCAEIQPIDGEELT